MLGKEFDRIYKRINTLHSRLSMGQSADTAALLLVRVLAEVVHVLNSAESRYQESGNDPAIVRDITEELIYGLLEVLGNYIAWAH